MAEVVSQFASVNSMIEALRSDDPEQRLESMRGLHLIAATLGPERVRGELLPFLTDYLDENDEVLREFAKGLGSLIPDAGGVMYAKSIIQPLELLCGLEDVSVRDEAINSLALVGATVFRDGSGQQQTEFLTLVQNMGRNESPQTRSAAAALVSVPYATVANSNKTNLRQLFQRLCADDEIMVRRAAIVALGERFAKVLDTHCSELLGVFTNACKDQSDGVRLQCVPTSINLVPHLHDSAVAQVVQLVRGLGGDPSWRVRYLVADRLHVLAKALSGADVVKNVFPLFRILCSDQEPEIRASAVFNMHALAAVSHDTIAKKDLVMAGARLVDDMSPHVRVSLASSLLQCTPHVSKDAWSGVIAGACTQLLQDNDAEVRLALVGQFNALGGTAEGREVAPKLVPVMIALSQDEKWRVRETVVLQLPSLIENLGTSAQEVLSVTIDALGDRVATIRDAACKACYQLIVENGIPWAKTNLFPRVLPFAEQQPRYNVPLDETEPSPHGYLRRVTFCHLVLALLPALDAPTLSTVFIPLLVQLGNDAIVNVRLNVGRIVARLAVLKASTKETEALLGKLSNDPDADVRDAVAMTLKERV